MEVRGGGGGGGGGKAGFDGGGYEGSDLRADAWLSGGAEDETYGGWWRGGHVERVGYVVRRFLFSAAFGRCVEGFESIFMVPG